MEQNVKITNKTALIHLKNQQKSHIPDSQKSNTLSPHLQSIWIKVKSMHQDLKSEYLVECIGNSLLVGLFLALIHHIYYDHPVAYVFLIAEDNWGEYGTFIYWLFSSFILAWVFFRYQDFRKPGYLVFALVAFLIAMEEISWGQRIFNIETPGFFFTNNYQGELNLHNLDSIKWINKYIGNIILLGTIVFPILTWFSNPNILQQHNFVQP